MLMLAAYFNGASDKAAGVAEAFHLSGRASAVARALWRWQKGVPTDAQGRALIVTVTSQPRLTWPQP